MQPRIIVSASVADPVPEYLEALRAAGADPLRVDARTDPMTALADADGLLVTGGVDVDPSRYGAPGSALIGKTEVPRDEFEEALLLDARGRGLPTLCICRGLHIANVAFGGTLIADLPTHLGAGSAIPHDAGAARQRGAWKLVPQHRVAIESDSLLAQITGVTSLVTNAAHHQAVAECASDLRVVGTTADGVVEALEARFASPFWLAVQWHPESTHTSDAASRAIIAAFVEAAGESA